ncbi:MAG: hypothetical protein A3I66_16415 [Burkholderiales bacterium RIFCSPLOWO2_02_FULL_57_36]|nr:MAG: hypothetical protein A3I66_16415 [Burkholderiales bacterium RIFCSPLOWO2_02_FULL_57_36]
MSHLDILLPFGLPPAEIAGDVLRELKTPALASLVARTNAHRREEFDALSRALPHETWLARQFGLEESMRKRGSPPVAAAILRAYGLTADAGSWFLLHPVHLQLARDHVLLIDQRQLSLSEQESRALFDAAKPLFDEIGKPLLYGDARTWFVRADNWDDLCTATADAAAGRNIAMWLPQGSAERDWRKLQNEIQMHWHTHPVNEKREHRGEKPVNSVWLWGGAAATADTPPVRYSELFNLPGWTNALGRSSSAPVKNGTASDIIAAAPKHGLTVLDQLIEPALAGEWSEWIDRLHALESAWLAPIADALKTGKISQVSLVMTHGTDLAEFITGRYSSKKFWVKPSLSRLAR